MPGGLLNIISYGSENLILNGNPSKTFFKQTYKKYTNFGLQRFRLDFEGQRVLNYNSPSHFTFKIPRYAELLWDTYIVVQLPNIYSSLYLYKDPSGVPQYKNYVDALYNNRKDIEILKDYIEYKDLPNSGICEFKFKWIENLGFNMIKEIVIKSNSKIIEKYSGETMLLFNERDNSTKNNLVNDMIGNISSLNNPGINNISYVSKLNTRLNNLNDTVYPNCIYNEADIEPSIRGRKLYIPLLSWFSKSSKNAFPLIALQYSDLEIDITFRPVSELYTLYDKHKDEYEETIIKNFSVDISPNYFGNGGIPDITEIKNFLSPPDIKENRPQTNIWNSDVHLLSTYVFLSNEERKQFASKNHEYLLKNIYEYEIKNAMGSERVEIPSKNLVSGYIFRFRRSDVDIRNQWSNYSNWPYENKSPISLSMIEIDCENEDCGSCDDVPREKDKKILSFANSSGLSTINNKLFNKDSKKVFCTGEDVIYSNKVILKNMAIMFNGTYRENILDNGIYNYVEKYCRTKGTAKDGIYIYNFSINSNRNDYQPSGSQNMNKTKNVVFEFNTEVSEQKEDIQATIVSEPSDLTNAERNIQNTIQAIRRNDSNKYENFKYDYELFVVEERYNILYIRNGLIELKYAK